MKFREIVAITGMPGLFQLVATKSDGAIVKNIDDGISKFVPARSHNVTTLEGIEVYTQADNVRLWDVFQRMKETAANAADFDLAKADNKQIKAYFQTRFPEYDEDRVYVSDMKKMLKWFDILNRHNLLDEEASAEQEVEEPIAAEVETAPLVEEKPVKTRKAKAKPAESAESTEAAVEEKKPRKPRAKKEKSED